MPGSRGAGLLEDFVVKRGRQTVEGFGILNEAEVDVFVELSCFYNDPTNVGSAPMGLTNQQ